MITETIAEPDAPSEADRSWWASESHDDQGHDLDTATADIPGVESPTEDDGSDMERRAAEFAWLESYECGWAAI